MLKCQSSCCEINYSSELAFSVQIKKTKKEETNDNTHCAE